MRNQDKPDMQLWHILRKKYFQQIMCHAQAQNITACGLQFFIDRQMVVTDSST